MVRFFIKSWAFFKRDFFEYTSYKMYFLLELGGIFATILSFFFIGKLVGDTGKPYLAEYGGNYFAFVIVGIAFSGYLSASLNSYTQAISNEQGLGTMEALLITPTGISTIVLGGAIWSFVFTSLRVFVYFVIGALVFGLDLSKANIPVALLTLAFTIASLSGFGVVSAGFTLMLKRGDPVNFFLNNFSRFLAGVYFPIALLPAWVQKCSLFIPLTYSLKAMRMAIINGATLSEVYSDVLALAAFSAVILPLSILFFSFSVRRVKITGSWVHY